MAQIHFILHNLSLLTKLIFIAHLLLLELSNTDSVIDHHIDVYN